MAQRPDNEDDDRETTLYHGTTLDVAEYILARKQFEVRETYFAASRDLACLFAIRSSKKRANAQRASLVSVRLYESDLKLWRQNRWVSSKGFDEGDQPALRGKTQLVFSTEGIRMLNRYMFHGEMSIEPAKNDA